ncbi:DNA-binding protein [Actinomadura litoris]|nr:DNA-binding protein [Actinomadura litoris]
MPAVPDPRERPTISVPEAGEFFGLKPAASYKAAERGEIPTIRVGRALKVPTAKFLDKLGLLGLNP